MRPCPQPVLFTNYKVAGKTVCDFATAFGAAMGNCRKTKYLFYTPIIILELNLLKFNCLLYHVIGF
ncbi:MAG: hypothetical protein J6P10_01710 [Aeriscardovia sp.]|nr:hypothetical protein [Aeriscardovia sp.]